MDKNKIKNKLKDDPAFTLEVQNPEVEELMTQYSSDKKAETLNKLIDKCTKSRFLVPANVGENNKPIPLFIKNGEGEAFMPIYTSKAQLSKNHPSPCIVNMPFLAVINMVANKESKLDGIAFNPFTHNLIFKRPLVEKIEAVEKARKEGHPTSPTKGKTVQMTAEQYVIFERIQYEHIFLPTQMFEGGKEFMDRLADEKEKLIDELYEEAYQQRISLLCPCRFQMRSMSPELISLQEIWRQTAQSALISCGMLLRHRADTLQLMRKMIKPLSWSRLRRITSVLDMELHRLRVLSFRLFLTWWRKERRN